MDIQDQAATASYPPELPLDPWRLPARLTSARVLVPGSKSLTNRALIVAALAEGPTVLSGALDSEDTRVMVEALSKLGIVIQHVPAASTIELVGCRGTVPAQAADLDLANSGTSLRFLTAMVATGRGKYRLDGSARMRQRPVGDLLFALNRLGAEASSEFGNGCPPVLLHAHGLDGGETFVRGDVSSQFLSGLLMALPSARERSSIHVDGNLVSKPYVEMTLQVMEAFGVKVENRKYRRFEIVPGLYHGREFAIEPDASAASYYFALGALTGRPVTVPGLGGESLQGDLAFLDILEHMGCEVERSPTGSTVRGVETLAGVDVDMNAISDTVMTLAVLALFARGHTRIRNVAHIRHKETDRIAALAIELTRLGATVQELPDGLIIHPPERLRPATIQTYDDHRMAMAFALAGVRAEGIVIHDPGCVAKTYPNFWIDWESARLALEGAG